MKTNKLNDNQREFIANNLNLVHKFITNVMHIYPSNTDYEDYFQEGCLTFCRVYLDFDPERGKLSTFLYRALYNDLIEYKRKCLSQIVLPRSKRSNIVKMLDEGYSIDDIVDALNVSSSIVIGILNSLNICNIESPIPSSDDKLTIQDTIPTDKNIEDIVLDNKCYNIIDNISYLLSKLEFYNDIHKQLYQEYVYGNIYQDTVNQKYLSDKYKVTQSYVSRIIRRYNLMLRKLIETELHTT